MAVAAVANFGCVLKSASVVVSRQFWPLCAGVPCLVVGVPFLRENYHLLEDRRTRRKRDLEGDGVNEGTPPLSRVRQ